MKNINFIYSDFHVAHNPQCEIYDGVKEPYAESPDRLTTIVSTLKKYGISKLYVPKSFPSSHITKVHHPAYAAFLKDRSSKQKKDDILYPSFFITDTYAPIVQATYKAAKISVDVALTGAKMLLSGKQMAYALCRPPGHHAEQSSMGGYCYFNNAAIAAEYLARHGKVAILDIDFHHGNGTQHTFYDRSDVLYVSLHADPEVKYPYISGFANEKGKGEGRGFTKNYPLPLGTTDKQYLTTLKKALKDIKAFAPTYLIVSAGFDTYEKDPICGFKLTIPFYQTIGQQISSLGLQTLIVQEGGYFVRDLGEIAWSLVQGLCKKR